mmetsp:Transcript_21637/g.50564  ORF Transcript_21637/g.50564 Transcript_21637/m.50564 type:complete len:83 (+) Transcript_21637:320-568(+)
MQLVNPMMRKITSLIAVGNRHPDKMSSAPVSNVKTMPKDNTGRTQCTPITIMPTPSRDETSRPCPALDPTIKMMPPQQRLPK